MVHADIEHHHQDWLQTIYITYIIMYTPFFDKCILGLWYQLIQ